MSEQERKNRTPLMILVGLVVAGTAGLAYVARDKGTGPVPVATAPESKPAEAPKPAEATKTAEAPEAPQAEVPETPPAAPATEQQTAAATPPAAEEASKAEQKPAEAPASEPQPVVPSFDAVRVEPDGSALIAGRASPDADVIVKLNGAEIAAGKANADGAFAIVPGKPLPAGAGVLSLETKTADGKVLGSEQTVAVASRAESKASPTVAILKPDEPTKVVQSGGTEASKLPPMATVNIDAVDYDEKGNMIFAGRGPAGSKVQLYMDNGPLAEAAIGADGTWSVAPANPIGVGAHTLRADEIGADGAVKSRVEIPFFREDAAKVIASRAPPASQPETKTENQTVAVTTPDQKTTVTATAPVTVEVKQAPAEPAAQPAAEPAKPAEQPVAEQPAAQPVQPAAPAEQPKVAEVPAAPVEQPQVAEVPAAPEAAPVAPEIAKPAEPAAQAPKVAAVQPEAPSAEPVPDAKIIIQPGNNLWRLSRRIYGKGTMYTVIYEANREYIRNPDLIYPGQIFLTPNAQAEGQ